MKVKLSDDDRCAIDLVLEERAAGDAQFEQCFGKSGGVTLQKRVARVEKLLNLLDQMPAEDPSAKLLAGTMKFITKHAPASPAAHVPVTRAAMTSQASSHRTLH